MVTLIRVVPDSGSSTNNVLALIRYLYAVAIVNIGTATVIDSETLALGVARDLYGVSFFVVVAVGSVYFFLSDERYYS